MPEELYIKACYKASPDISPMRGKKYALNSYNCSLWYKTNSVSSNKIKTYVDIRV